MSAFSHNSQPAERLALGWHWLGVYLSVAAMLAHACCAWFGLLAYVPERLRHDTVALDIGCSIIAAAGIGWHIWAVYEHKKALEFFSAKTRLRITKTDKGMTKGWLG